MPIDPSRLCPCHGEPMYCERGTYYCHTKRRAVWRARRARYLATQNGRSRDAAGRALRLFAGPHYLGRATSPEQQQQLQTHIDARIRAFKARHE